MRLSLRLVTGPVALCLLAALFPRLSEAGATIGQPIETFTLSDYRGREYSLSEFKNGPVVVAFLGTECPLAKLYGPRLQELADTYADQGVSVIGISSNVQDSMT